ncbi:MAG: FecR domain-containing protein [Vulcanimicrobiaceae bacterium]
MRGAISIAALLCVAAILPARGADDNVLRRDSGIVTYKLPDTQAISLTGSVPVSDAVIATTAVESLARLQLRDSSEIRIGDRTTVRIGDLASAAAATPGATIYMDRGAVRFAITHPKGGKANYRFVTPSSALAVRGTVGYFVVGPAGQQIYCVKCEAGDVSVEAAGKSVEVRSGQTLNLGVDNGTVTSSQIVPNRTINNPAIDQFLGGASPFGQAAATGADFTQSGSGISRI